MKMSTLVGSCTVSYTHLPILMTTLTTVLAMLQLVFSGDMASQLMSGMARCV